MAAVLSDQTFRLDVVKRDVADRQRKHRCMSRELHVLT